MIRPTWTALRTKIITSGQHQEVYNNQPHPLVPFQHKRSLNSNSDKTLLLDTSPPFFYTVIGKWNTDLSLNSFACFFVEQYEPGLDSNII